MAEWVLVENEQIVEYHDLLPSNWKNYSGLNLSEDYEFLRSIGWYKVRKNHNNGVYDLKQFKFVGFEYTFEGGFVLESMKLIPFTEEEINSSNVIDYLAFMSDLKQTRNKLLAESDWTQLADVVATKNGEWILAWQAYRKELRDLPSFYPKISVINWPTIPNL